MPIRSATRTVVVLPAGHCCAVWSVPSPGDDLRRRTCHAGVHSTRDIVKYHGFLRDKDLVRLCLDTGFTREELYKLFGTFKALCALSSSPYGIGTWWEPSIVRSKWCRLGLVE